MIKLNQTNIWDLTASEAQTYIGKVFNFEILKNNLTTSYQGVFIAFDPLLTRVNHFHFQTSNENLEVVYIELFSMEEVT